MGYELHINRSSDQSGGDGPPITRAEWDAHVAADPELMPDPVNPGCVLWSGPSTLADPWLLWSEPGSISTKYPDAALIAKMARIAAYFGAQVQGDDGEFYNEAGPIPEAPVAVPKRRPWWRIWSR